MSELDQFKKAMNAFSDSGRNPMWMVFEEPDGIDIGKVVKAVSEMIQNERIGSVSQIDEHIQDVGEYELILTLRLK